ncbi:MAG: pentapeptide repeat-containing protein [Planctomycetota bacterium]
MRPTPKRIHEHVAGRWGLSDPAVLVGVLRLLLAWILLAAAPALASPPSAGVTLADSPWLLEEQFALDPTFHATPEQTVVLHLEGRGDAADAGHTGRGRGAIRRNTFRFLVGEAGDFSFCIPEDEPHIVRLKLKGPTSSGKGGLRTLSIARGNTCRSATLAPGSHTVEVDHDSRGIPAGGRKAFFHKPQKARLLGDVQAGFGTPDFIAFRRASTGKFVGGTSAKNGGHVLATATDVGPGEVWNLFAFNATDVEAAEMYLLAPANNQGFMLNLDNLLSPDCDFSTSIFVFPPSDCPFLPSPFHINDRGGGDFDLVLDTVGTPTLVVVGGIYVNASEELFYNTNKPFVGGTLTWEYKGFDCATTCDDTTLPLGAGEIALYAQCDYQGPAMVFQANAADLSLYDGAAARGLAIGSGMASSIRVGPDTLAVLYDEAQFGGSSQAIAVDVPCLDTTAIGENTAASFRIQSASEYIVTTDGCQGCVLTGSDLLSGGDFSGANFSQALLDGANLTDTILTDATLVSTHFSSAELSGADFSGATLSCAHFDHADLTAATLDDNEIAEDFSCRLDLSGATLDFATFPKEDWQFFNMQGTVVENVPDVLSTVSEPLDLSGAILSNVSWLAGKQLDGAKLGCATNPTGDSVCTQLGGADLTEASLQQATLTGAVLSGADLNRTNLLGADLSAAQLVKGINTAAATLEGAYLKCAQLVGADLTGASLVNANFYGTCTNSAGVNVSASAANATMTAADFTGAYLAGADFSNAILQGAIFPQAVLVGASFDSADLGADTSVTGSRADFDGAFLQGADFSNANVADADFNSAYLDLDGGGNPVFQLFPENLVFTGCEVLTACTGCVPATYNDSTTPPSTTDSANICPDGGEGPCDVPVVCTNQDDMSLERWECPSTVIADAEPPSSDDLSMLPDSCTTIDFSW